MKHPLKILVLDLGPVKHFAGNIIRCFFDSQSRTHSFLNAATDRNDLSTVFKKHKIDLVVMEACGPSGWIHDLELSMRLNTLVCSTDPSPSFPLPS